MGSSRLTQVRERRGISLHRAALDTRLAKKTLAALESNQPTGLHPEYEAGVRATYRRYLGLPAETTEASKKSGRQAVTRRRNIRPRKTATAAMLLRRALLTAIVGLTVGYGLWQLISLVSAPRLSLSEPAGDAIVTSSSLDIRGRTSSGAEVFINNEPVLIEPDGHFNETISLHRGLNDIEIVAVNALAKRAVIHRTIVFQPD